jgi:hypothetical protein
VADGTLMADGTLSFPGNLIRPNGGFFTVMRLLDEPLLVNAILRSDIDPECPLKGLECRTGVEVEERPVGIERLLACTVADEDSSDLIFPLCLRFAAFVESKMANGLEFLEQRWDPYREKQVHS